MSSLVQCTYCERPAWFQDRQTGEMLCPAHARLEVHGPRWKPAGETQPLHIRPATPDDEPTVLEFWLHFWDETSMDCFGKLYQAVETPALLACDEDEVVGVLSYSVERDWDAINMVALNVLPGYQGRGGAAALMEELEAMARREGIGRLIVATSNDNAPALTLYQLHGYQITGVKVASIAPDHGDEQEIGVCGLPVRDEIQLEKRLGI